MSKVIKLKKGLDIKLDGSAESVLIASVPSMSYGVRPTDFEGVTPKLLVKVGDRVKAGTAVLFDKCRPNLLFASPVSGTVKEIVRGEKRKLLDVVIEPDDQIEYEKFDVPALESLSVDQIKEIVLKAGLWPVLIQRPYGTIASEKDTPRAIYISLFDSAPLSPDVDLIIEQGVPEFEKGLAVLKKLSDNKLFVGVNAVSNKKNIDIVSKYATVNTFSPKHPAGCVGIQIANTQPMAKGEVVWTIDPQAVLFLGRLFMSGILDMRKLIAVTGSEIKQPRYHKIISGAKIESFLSASNIKEQQFDRKVRVIDGNVLTGNTTSVDQHFGYYKNCMTVIPEGDNYELLGWIAPRFNKFSVSRSYFSWLTPFKKYTLDTNLNGGQRAFVMNGEYDNVLPMDIFPVFLLKAIMANDIDKMENLGIYEVIEEDLALCEFVCTSKIEVQSVLRQGIRNMIKELN